jgi:L-rhamnose mutarotase
MGKKSIEMVTGIKKGQLEEYKSLHAESYKGVNDLLREMRSRKLPKKIKRVGKVIEIKEDRLEEYKTLHAGSNPGVRDLLSAVNIQNFSIYVTQLPDGKYYLFSYYEYTGEDYQADMAKLDAEPRIKKWLEMCNSTQISLQKESGWKVMDPVYYND